MTTCERDFSTRRRGITDYSLEARLNEAVELWPRRQATVSIDAVPWISSWLASSIRKHYGRSALSTSC